MNKPIKKNPGAGATATEIKKLRSKQGGIYIWGDAFATLSLAESLQYRPQGWYHVQTISGETAITIYRPGQPEEVILCLSPGHANQLRQELTDAGMCGLIEGAD